METEPKWKTLGDLEEAAGLERIGDLAIRLINPRGTRAEQRSGVDALVAALEGRGQQIENFLAEQDDRHGW